jgi:hypothetical protein
MDEAGIEYYFSERSEISKFIEEYENKKIIDTDIIDIIDIGY